tara:strand:+ start:1524 stop:2093 length:570 start_codon:yes stop_codon:yes gene_type:complete
MQFRYLPSLCLLFFILSCSVPTDSNNNPLDPEEAVVLEFDTPALVCFPAEQTIPTGPVTIKLFAMGVTELSGAYVRVKYNKAKLNYTQTISGDFFADAQDPIFFYEHNSTEGTITVTTSFLGSDSVAVDGTGSLVEFQFTATSVGTSTVSIVRDSTGFTASDSTISELVGANDQPIEILGYTDGVIIAQ